MATSGQMIAAGIAFVVDTVLLIYFSFIVDKVFQPIVRWAYAFQYSKEPPFDQGIMTWIFPSFYGMLVLMWFALLAGMYLISINRATYGMEV